jgi:WD40 repeat protein
MEFGSDGTMLITASSDQSAILWDTTALELAPQIGQPLGAYRPVFSPDQRILATAQPDNTVALWDITDPSQPHRVGQPLGNHSDRIIEMRFSADGKTLAVGSSDNTVTLWDLTGPEQPRALGQPIRIGPPDPSPVEIGEATLVSTGPESLASVALSPDGSTLATSQQVGIKLWDLTDREHPRPIGSPFQADAFIFDLSFSPDGLWLATSTSVWDIADREQPVLLTEDVGGIFLPDGPDARRY